MTLRTEVSPGYPLPSDSRQSSRISLVLLLKELTLPPKLTLS